jgi:quercetin dioxygenase-like cupin family protein
MEPSMTETETDGWITMFAGVRRRTLVAGERMMQIAVILDRGAHVPEHRHPHEQIAHVLRGRLRLTLAGVAHEIDPGESLYIPGHAPHSAEALEETLVVDTFSPPREDLLEEDQSRTKSRDR